jgi:hypothetical protein
MPSKTKTALAALFILGPVSVVVLAGPNNRVDDHGSVRTVSVSNGRTGVVNHAAKPLEASVKGAKSGHLLTAGSCQNQTSADYAGRAGTVN